MSDERKQDYDRDSNRYGEILKTYDTIAYKSRLLRGLVGCLCP